MRFLILALLPLILLGPACPKAKPTDSAMAFLSQSFNNYKPIPKRHSCEGANESPHLLWKNLPKNTQSLALIVDDPDAVGGFVHWMIWNIDPSAHELPANLSKNTFNQGLNSANQIGYTGPCPPSGQHHYYFRLYALDKKLSLANTVNKEQLVAAMKGHILGEAQIMGTFAKKAP